ncbi:MAG: glutathione peroxidase, partial [Acidobacteria bacterium]|nr:glutathione peroxidase [Acidobacteriota bacterium]
MTQVNLTFQALNGDQLCGAGGFHRPTLVVNTASECGFTPQYRELQRLWEQYRERGLIVLGVPCNDFGAQEPGEPGQITAFCQKNFGVTFPLAAKAQILDKTTRHPFYQSVADTLGEEHLPRWNFHKDLVSGDGQLLDAWPSKISPLAREITD